MSTPRIEDYAFLSDTRSAAMVSRRGNVEWLTFPRFDSPAAMAALVGTADDGHFLLTPEGPATTTRRYLPGTLVLETTHTTDSGVVVVTDALAMPQDDRSVPRLLRRVRGTSGSVPMRMELRIRFGYGRIVPWVRRLDHHLLAVGGPDALVLRSNVEVHGEGMATVAAFTLGAGDECWFDLAWFESHRATPHAAGPSVAGALDATVERWRSWSDNITYDRDWADDVRTSATILKGLTYSPTGAIVAAPTTSLPEDPGGVRNWDYRYCWLRDATFTLYALVQAGLRDEALRWRDWLLRSAAGDPESLQIMYGLAGERWLPEFELDELAGFGGARPVRIGNQAADQLQLDVFGEVADSMYQARVAGMPWDAYGDRLLAALTRHLSSIWTEPDEGIWEVRGDRQHFTHSKVMAWVAFDRAAKAATRWGTASDRDRWRAVADDVHRDVCEHAVDGSGVFRQAYGSTALDAAVLRIPLVGFLPPDDSRVVATVDAVEHELTQDGLVLRYRTEQTDDGLAGDEGAFLLCSFWLADALEMIGRRDDAVALYERLLSLRNDVGLLAEEYGTHLGAQLGNCPQAFSHVSIINTATNLCGGDTAGTSTSRSRS